MPSILAFGRTTQATSAAGIPTAFDQLAPNGAVLSTFLSVQQVVTNPTFAGITSLTPQSNGSLLASWSAGTTPNPILEYDVYIQLGTATGLFSSGNKTRTTFGTSIYLFTLADSTTLLVAGSTYFVGVRARDPLGNVSVSTASLSATSTGVNPGRVLAYPDIPDVVAAVWNALKASYNTADTMGAALNEADAKAVLIDTKIGTPVSSVSADVAAVKTVVDTINTKTGTPVTSIAADIAAVKAVDDTIDTKIGTPVSSVSADIAAVKSDTGTTVSRLGTPVGSSFSADYQSIQTGVNTTNTRLGTPVGANLSADIAAVKADEVTLLSRLTPGRAANLDNLDAQVSLTQTATVAATQYNQVRTDVGGVLSAVQSIQNNTDFVGIVPQAMEIPNSGSNTYRLYVNLHDSLNAPMDPDSQMNYQITTIAGSVLVATTAMTRDSIGVFHADYVVNTGVADTDIVVKFTYDVSSVPFVQYRTSKIQSTTGDLNTLVNLLTPARAANLDNLDAAVTSRLSDADSLTRQSALLNQHATTQTAVAAVSTKIGAPVLGSVTADVAAVRIQTDKIGSPAGASVSADIAAIKADTASALTKLGTPVLASLSADVAGVKTDVAAVKADTVSALTKLGTPVGVSLSADVAAVKADTVPIKVQTDKFNFTGANVDANAKVVSDKTDYALSAASAASVVDQVWDEVQSGHTTSGTTGASLAAGQSASVETAAIKAKTDNLPSDPASNTQVLATQANLNAHLDAVDTNVLSRARAQYVNQMTTTYDPDTGLQEVITWAEKDGSRVTISSACTITIKTGTGVTVWTQTIATPNADGVFRFTNAITAVKNRNYYIVISITVDSVAYQSQQPFFVVG